MFCSLQKQHAQLSVAYVMKPSQDVCLQDTEVIPRNCSHIYLIHQLQRVINAFNTVRIFKMNF